MPCRWNPKDFGETVPQTHQLVGVKWRSATKRHVWCRQSQRRGSKSALAVNLLKDLVLSVHWRIHRPRLWRSPVDAAVKMMSGDATTKQDVNMTEIVVMK